MLPGTGACLWLLAVSAFVESTAAGACTNCSSSSTANVRWLGSTPSHYSGATFGLPWPRGAYQSEKTDFTAYGSGVDGNKIPLQSWVTAYWPDGSIKWTGHAIPESETIYDAYTIKASGGKNSTKKTRRAASDSTSLSVTNSDDEVNVDTGKLAVAFAREGSILIKSIKTSSGKTVGKNGKLILHSQSAVAEDAANRGNTSIDYFNFESKIEDVKVSKENSVRALVTIRGKHQVADDSAHHDDWLPFILRFYMYAESDSIRVIHTIVYDGNAEKDFITGVGIRFEVPLAGEELYNRHVRLAGVDGGLLSEAIQGITGLRRDPGAAVRQAQFEGKETPDIGTWDTRVSSRMKWIPTWGEYSLTQLSPDGFTLKKRTKPGQSWINIPGGTHAGGLAYLGGATVGGLAVGLRDFWKHYPTGLDIANAASDEHGEITLWLYSPSAPPLDLRPFHDGMGQDTYAEQLDALEITYEDYEPKFNTPYGIARTNEIYLFGFEQTPPRDRLAALTEHMNKPPVLIAEPEYMANTKAIGTYWGLPDTSTEAAAEIEDHLDFLATFYQGQVEQRRWYGFLDGGDFMHTYDGDRHTWRYDVGGYAWDNSELSPDLFFWQYFLRTGREDVYRFAEAMTRHTGEVDVYHIGDWKGLGTRHGVQHWADSAKQARISQPQYRKYFYYISGGDERVGELLEECLDSDQTYGILDPQRKVRNDGWTPSPNSTVAFSLGTDWSALAAGWLIEWERRGSRWEEAKTKLTNTVKGIANLKYGFVTGSGLYDPKDWTLGPPPADPDNKGYVSVSHLSAVFGLLEVVSDAIDYWGDDLPEGFYDAWLDYCYYYGATSAEQTAKYGKAFGSLNLHQGHSRLTAWAAHEMGNSTLAKRAWREYFTTDGFGPDEPWTSKRLNGSEVLVPVDEAAWITTNDVAQYGLASIQNLVLVRDALESWSS